METTGDSTELMILRQTHKKRIHTSVPRFKPKTGTIHRLESAAARKVIRKKTELRHA